MFILRLPQAYRSSSRQHLRLFMRPCRWISALMRDATSGTLRRDASFTPALRQVPSIILRLMGEYKITTYPKKYIGVIPVLSRPNDVHRRGRGLCIKCLRKRWMNVFSYEVPEIIYRIIIELVLGTFCNTWGGGGG
jgi:hypothetical protein